MKATAPWTYTALVKCGLIQPPASPGPRGVLLQSHRAERICDPVRLHRCQSIAGEGSAGSYHPVADELRETGWNLTAYPGSVD